MKVEVVTSVNLRASSIAVLILFGLDIELDSTFVLG